MSADGISDTVANSSERAVFKRLNKKKIQSFRYYSFKVQRSGHFADYLYKPVCVDFTLLRNKGCKFIVIAHFDS